ncbi:MAG TPA: hypothetical protein VMT99_00930 [Candidatus Paceibacterota bacterium]|nr:hypothetical protein [Candidatus Paceibacterota bacterium]
MNKRTISVACLLALTAFLMPLMAINASSMPKLKAFGTLPAALSLRVTAYTSVPDETDDTPFITADGSYVYDGVAASNMFPFGTKIMIPSLFGDKIFTIEDRMAPYFKKSIDIWMPTVGKALYFGVHTADIVIVAMPTEQPVLASVSLPSDSTVFQVAGI